MASPRPLQFPTRRGGLPASQQTLATAGLALVAIALAALIGHDVVFPPAQNAAANLRTATVARGTVRSAVSATGTLVPAQQLNVGFKTAGTLTEVDVKVGDHVGPGQVLAKLDPAQLQLALDQANASLAAARANLNNTMNGTALVQAQHQLDQARQSYNNALSQLNADQNALNADTGNYWYQQYSGTLTTLQAQLAADNADFAKSGCIGITQYPGPSPSPSPTPTPSNCYTLQQQVQSDLTATGCIQGIGANCTPTEQQIGSAYKAVQVDQAKVNADNTLVQNAQNQVTNAQDSYNNQAVNRPATIASQQAAVAQAQAQVNTAQQNLSSAVLTAPTTGVVASINGSPGDVVSAQTTSSVAQAPGSTAPLPSSGGGSASGSSGAAGGGASAFITLLNTSAYQAVVTFAEADAAKLQAGQQGVVTFDALPNVTIPVHVLAIAPAATVVSNVVNYYVTLNLDSLNSSLRAGLTANAQIVTSQASNVLTVPNSAITRIGQNAFVTVLGANGVQARTPVQLGIAGDTTTEVTSGLQPGDRVVLPQLRTSSSPGRIAGFGGGVIAGGRR